MLSMIVTVLIVLAGVYIGWTMILLIYNEFTAKRVTFLEAMVTLLIEYPDAYKVFGYTNVVGAAWTISTTDDWDRATRVLLGL